MLIAFERAGCAMHLFQILLPCANNAGRPLEKEDFDRVKEELAGRFPGVTVHLQKPAEGVWRQGTASSNDDIVDLAGFFLYSTPKADPWVLKILQ
jgi:hypothetical protein